jgi:hypothetical protein
MCLFNKWGFLEKEKRQYFYLQNIGVFFAVFGAELQISKFEFCLL